MSNDEVASINSALSKKYVTFLEKGGTMIVRKVYAPKYCQNPNVYTGKRYLHMKIRKVFALCLSLLMVCCALWAAIPQARAAEVTPVQTEMYGRTALVSLDNSTALLYAYDQLVKGIGASQQEISVYDGKNPISIDEISIVLDAYGRDHTYHFWLGNSYSISYNSTSILKVLPAYIMEGAALEEAKIFFGLVKMGKNATIIN